MILVRRRNLNEDGIGLCGAGGAQSRDAGHGTESLSIPNFRAQYVIFGHIGDAHPAREHSSGEREKE